MAVRATASARIRKLAIPSSIGLCVGLAIYAASAGRDDLANFASLAAWCACGVWFFGPILEFIRARDLPAEVLVQAARFALANCLKALAVGVLVAGFVFACLARPATDFLPTSTVYLVEVDRILLLLLIVVAFLVLWSIPARLLDRERSWLNDAIVLGSTAAFITALVYLCFAIGRLAAGPGPHTFPVYNQLFINLYLAVFSGSALLVLFLRWRRLRNAGFYLHLSGLKRQPPSWPRRVGRALLLLPRSALVLVALALPNALCNTFLLRTFYLGQGYVSGVNVGDYMVISKYAYGYGRYSFPFGAVTFSGRVLERLPSRGDAVIFSSEDGRSSYVSRVIGLPGEKIIRNGRFVSVQGQTLLQVAVGGATGGDCPRYRETLPDGTAYAISSCNVPATATPEVQVPDRHVFVISDARNSGSTPNIGLISADMLIGRISLTIGPPWRNERLTPKGLPVPIASSTANGNSAALIKERIELEAAKRAAAAKMKIDSDRKAAAKYDDFAEAMEKALKDKAPPQKPVVLPTGKARDPMYVDVASNGQIQLNQQEVKLEDLVVKLQALAKARGGTDGMVYVRSDNRVEYSVVAAVLARISSSGLKASIVLPPNETRSPAQASQSASPAATSGGVRDAQDCDAATPSDCAMRAVGRRLSQEASYLAGQNFRQEGPTRTEVVASGHSAQYRISLTGGVEYAFVAACDSSCRHVEIVLSTPEQRALARSPEQQPIVILNGAVPGTSTYLVSLSAPGCANSTCAVGLAVLRK